MSETPDVKAALARVNAANTRAGRASTGEFSLEGTRLLERALRAGVIPSSVLIGTSYGSSPREKALLEELTALQAKLLCTSDEAIRSLVGGRTFGDIVALARSPGADHGIPRTDHLLVAVDIQDPGNMGALIRTAAAAGLRTVLTVGTSDAYHPKAVRTSMGAIFKTQVVELPQASELWSLLAGSGHVTLASVPQGGNTPWSKSLPDAPSAILMGSEAFGLDAEIQARCDYQVSLPQSDAVDSYSVNAAAAMLLYELQRRALTR